MEDRMVEPGKRDRQRVRKIALEAQRQLAERGMAVEGGFAAYHLMVLPEDVGPIQLLETRRAFYAGAQHLFSTILHMLDPGEDPTEADLTRMDAIDKELRDWARSEAADFGLKL
jgi:hypothetical protein